ncbi:hypothetical protein CH276_18785 [Rhodococcus sp. 06-470-2]|uniref:hypothetical protein n=1 Tax=unclassified Rhodococcus (in: high G+C Gram-positive bacteria) TaxID=192944 RepID=UPI000B9C37AB|nr:MULTISPECIES: hypothetical protein [unclassified Rhodococcus (in: high G+C Gram-positive bacteria)]OZC60024.1 hypothetical protein CH276_18785 [Rhodococcus sp. 06-470-2]OZE56958.1 hypothetical protein CH265_24530 [Rhodococcus sp. 05-2221-1B]
MSQQPETPYRRRQRYHDAAQRIRKLARQRHANMNLAAGRWVMYERDLTDLADECERVEHQIDESTPELDARIRAALALPRIPD